MKVRILGCPEYKRFRPFIKKAVNYYSSQLISDVRIRRNIELLIKFSDKYDDIGTCCVEDYNTNNKARSFIIELKSDVGASEILRTLAHEMVHMKQYVNGELDAAMTVWRGNKIDSDKIDYYSQPWEMEAFAKEVGLFNHFCAKEKLWDIFKDIRNPQNKDHYPPKNIEWR